MFHDGMPAWKKAKQVVVSTPQYLKESLEKDIPNVVIDLRDPEVAKKGHVPGAVTLPARKVALSKDMLPADKKAPIVLYGDYAQDVTNVFKTIRDWDYSNTSILKGGFEAWKAVGNTETGELKATIVYIPKPRPGEITVEEFKILAETLPKDILILDIRDVDEAMHGMLKGARNIPSTQIPGRLSEIPKDKGIITYCTTGVRAEMAYHLLKEAGYKARFLNATIKIDKDGKYEITKE